MTSLPVILPKNTDIKVSVGDKVKAGHLIAEKTGSAKDEVIKFSDFGISKENFKKSLKKNLGDGVEAGEKVASMSGMLGMNGRNVVSKTSGTISKIDEEEGEVHVRDSNPTETEAILSPVDGTVEICDNDKIVISTDEPVIVAKDGLGNETEGDLLHITVQELDKLTSSIGDKVILVKSIDRVYLFKAIGLDVNGIIAESFENIDFIDLTEKKIKAAIMVVEDNDFKKLEKAKNKKVYLNPNNKSILII